jgi:PPOX class probable F420-dependent enzyme
MSIPDSHKDLLEKPVFAVFTSITPNGEPQSTVIWIDYDGEYLRVNSSAGRHKNKNMAENPNVSVMLVDPENPYRWMAIRGKVEGITEDGAVDHINTLSKKYNNGQQYYGPGGYSRVRQDQETRVLFKVRPVKVLIYPKH